MTSQKATLIGLVAIVLWSTMVGLIRGVSEGLGPVGGAAMIYSLSGLLLIFTVGLPDIRRFPGRYLIAGSVLFVSYEICLALSLGYAATRHQAIEVGMVNYLWPSLTILFAILFNGQKTNWLIVPGLLMLVAVAVTSLLAAGVVNAAEVYNKDGNKLDLYGKVHAQHYFSDDNGSDGDKTYARLGFKGETQINDQLTGFGQWEYEFKGNRTESQGADKDKTRLAFAGLKFADYGSFDYGRNYGVAYDIGAWTDVLPEFGGDTWTQTDVFMTGRTTGVATYRNTDFFGLVEGLNFAAQYQGKNDRDGAYESNGDGFGLSATYEYEGFGVGAAYAKSDRTNNQVKAASNLNAAGKNAEVWAAGLKYDANNIYLATTYSETLNMTTFGEDAAGDAFIANKTQNFEAVAQYQFDFGLRPSIAYLKSKGKNLGTYGDQDLVEYIDVGATYYFNKNMSTFVDYKINLLDDSDFTKAAKVSTDNIVAVGLNYQF
ncbi:porin [Salmonella enterica]|nr:porin [Salmonella enterica]